MNDLITIIINVFNGEKYIKRCLDSVLSQTYSNLEILIVNDGSTDKTLDICKSYKDSRIRIISTKNLGLSLSRNVGIDHAKGEYLYFVDADDFIEKDTIEYLYRLSIQYHSELTTCDFLTIYNSNYSFPPKKEKIRVMDSYDMLKDILLSVGCSVSLWNKLIHKSIFRGIRFEDRIVNDICVTYKLAIAANCIVSSNQVKYYYFKHHNAITVKNSSNYNRAVDLYHASLERYQYIKNIYPNIIENEIGMFRTIFKLCSYDSPQVRDFLEKENLIPFFKHLFSYKMLLAPISLYEKMKMILFVFNDQLYNKLSLYHKKRNMSKIQE